jgi:hypothetical protein
MNIIINIGNDVTYKHATFYYKILCIVDYTKNKKPNKSDTFENIHTRIFTFFIFFM